MYKPQGFFGLYNHILTNFSNLLLCHNKVVKIIIKKERTTYLVHVDSPQDLYFPYGTVVRWRKVKTAPKSIESNRVGILTACPSAPFDSSALIRVPSIEKSCGVF